eukprot:CAMPEP_0195510026 /NCGR_PEP_ID=MMETSP0794_2-20130614/2794_1 /TAXON_ID=515487 /ORGANISM="Stephanopyxis turris, Strain CCMP 815" /LENGTH=170 /DNA_ID=CAMNT_0040637373 /DNA_START=232 /DNA_END=744 /DNA_ORIENTATION=-
MYLSLIALEFIDASSSLTSSSSSFLLLGVDCFFRFVVVAFDAESSLVCLRALSSSSLFVFLGVNCFFRIVFVAFDAESSSTSSSPGVNLFLRIIVVAIDAESLKSFALEVSLSGGVLRLHDLFFCREGEEEDEEDEEDDEEEGERFFFVEDDGRLRDFGLREGDLDLPPS